MDASMPMPIPRRRRSRGFSLSLSINSPRLSIASSSNTLSPISPPPTVSPFKRALKRISSFRIFHPRSPSSSSAHSYHWNTGMLDTDYMYDDDIDVSYEGLLSLAARIGDAKARNLPSELKDNLPRGIYKDCLEAQVEHNCAICLDKYEPHQAVMGISECSHYFHANCFETWLDLASNCPVCRRELTPEDYKRTCIDDSPPSHLQMMMYGYSSHTGVVIEEEPSLMVVESASTPEDAPVPVLVAAEDQHAAADIPSYQDLIQHPI